MTKEVMIQALSALLLAEDEMNCKYGVTELLRQAIAQAEKQEQGEPVAYISSTKQNHLVNKAQYDSMEEKNREHFDIPLYDKPQPKQNQSEPLGYLRQVGCSENPPHGWAFYFSSGEIPVYTTPQTKEWVGLNDEDMEFLFPFGKSAWLTETLKVFEAKLKEKNT